MVFQGIPDLLWPKGQGFVSPEDKPELCQYAQRFQDWAETLCARVEQEKNIALVNQAKILLVDKYFDWRASVPKSHRFLSGYNGHICIFQVFTEAYQRLKAVELAIAPPFIMLDASPPPPLPQIAGIFIGEKG